MLGTVAESLIEREREREREAVVSVRFANEELITNQAATPCSSQKRN
jgi:hypothetical protein